MRNKTANTILLTIILASIALGIALLLPDAITATADVIGLN